MHATESSQSLVSHSTTDKIVDLPADNSHRHTLTNVEKADYLQAEKCLLAAPAKGGIVDGAETRWDELHWVHITQSNVIHSVGDFLPWHRLYMRLHEKLLQDECDYTGAQPYWDEQRDADASVYVADASVWGSDELSFGATQDGCVVDGAFANTTLRLNQLWGVRNTTEYCLSHHYDDSYWAWANSTYSDTCFAKANYSDASPCWSKYPHFSAHVAVGGTVSLSIQFLNIYRARANSSFAARGSGRLSWRSSVFPSPHEPRSSLVEMATSQPAQPSV